MTLVSRIPKSEKDITRKENYTPMNIDAKNVLKILAI
jgi:hypothetical protein